MKTRWERIQAFPYGTFEQASRPLERGAKGYRTLGKHWVAIREKVWVGPRRAVWRWACYRLNMPARSRDRVFGP